MVKNVMSGKLKLKGHLKHLARWPLYLSVLLIALNVLVYVISIKAGIVVTMGIILYVGAAIGLLFYHRPLMFNDLIAFASLFVFKSISLPFILLAVIEFAIYLNMAIPYYQGVTLPFVASIVIGAIQLGATVDYAILMTSNYQKQRHLGKTKKDSISIAHKFSMKSIIVSGCSFFAATFGVALYSQVDMIGSICTLLARGAVISTIVVLLVLPAMFMVFDPIIVHTSKGFLPDKK